MHAARELFSYRKYWAHKFGPAPVLPMSLQEMADLGWDSCDVIIVTGDAYVDHPSFGMAVIGRVLEAQGFRVGIIAQPDWRSKDDFMRLGKPNICFGVTAGNMDSMVNRYTADRKIRSNDAYTPEGKGGMRPDRSVNVYAQRCREAYKDVPLIIGGIEASLRRIAHYDYWSETVRRSVLLDSKADLLLFGNAERAIVDVVHRLSDGESINSITDLPGTAYIRQHSLDGWLELDSSEIDEPGSIEPHPDPYAKTDSTCSEKEKAQQSAGVNTATGNQVVRFTHNVTKHPREKTCIRLPDYEKVKSDPVLYAHASRVFHLETNPGNARAIVQRHGKRDVWINPPPTPLTTEELDRIFELNYTRQPHPDYGTKNIPAYEMIRFSINIMRGCFGGCTFCSITEHEGRIIQSRSEDSIIKEIETIRDTVPGFTGIISDLGGPTANMYRLACKSEEIESACRRLSCVYPGICKNLDTNHLPLIKLYRRARKLPGVKKVLIASGLRYDLAIESPEYVKELVTHHVGGYLKIAPEHTETGPLSKMMKPGMGTYDRFKKLFERYSQQAGKEQYLIPYFIAAHPGTTDEDMMNLALWLKQNGFRADQVQTFLPSPMALATAMYHSGKNPLKKVTHSSETVLSAKGLRQRRLHKAFLRYHDAENWPLLRKALQDMGRADLIGNGKKHLVPSWQPRTGKSEKPLQKKGARPGERFATQHTGLPKTGATHRAEENGKTKKVRKRSQRRHKS